MGNRTEKLFKAPPSAAQASADILRKGKCNPMKAPLRQRREAAEVLAVQALGFIAGDGERLAHFLNMTGIAAADIRRAAREPSFLAGVLEHMLGAESLLLAFAADAGIDPAAVARAKSVLTTDWERDLP